mgnify:CR=1 FL=1
MKTNIIVTIRAGPKTSNKIRKLLINKKLGFKCPISFNNPESTNEISQIKIYFKFDLSNKVFHVHHYVLFYI